MAQIVTRFAPSPTGHLHIGGARSALFCWAYAHRMRMPDMGSHDGRFMIRIEDTDQARSSEESARGILEDLAWLGIEWDDGPRLEVRHSAFGIGHSQRPGNAGLANAESRVPNAAGSARVIGANARDVGSYFQAQRLPIYRAYIQWMIEHGKAYPAFETSEELEVKRKAAVAAKQTYRYDRASWTKHPTPEARLARMAEAKAKGEGFVVRFYAPHEEIVVQDQVLGDVRYAAGEMDDFVILKADGFPTYHFAVVIDDELMGVTHVLRAQEHLINTPRHVALQRSLVRLELGGHGPEVRATKATGEGFRTPVYGHMPLICNMDGSKMSKRDKAKAARKALKDAMGKDKSLEAGALAREMGLDAKVLSDFVAAENDSLEVAEALARKFRLALPEIEVWDFRKNGYVPGAIVNFLALLGWNPGEGVSQHSGKDVEKFDMGFLAQHFSIERIGRGSAKFDRAKLLSFNGDYLAAMSDEEFRSRWMEWMAEYEPDAHARVSAWSMDKQLIAVRAVKPRAKTLRDGLRPIGFALVGDDGYEFDPAAVEKHLKDAATIGGASTTGLALLREFQPRLDAIADAEWTPERITGVIDAFAKEKGMANPGGIAQPLRVALTGSGVSPGLGEAMAILGRASSLARVARCVATCERCITR